MDRPLDEEGRIRAQADAEWVWRALTVEPGVGIALLRVDGFVIYANRAMCEIWTPTGKETIEMTGRHVRDRFGPEMVADLLGVVQRVVERDEPIVRRAIFRGRQIESTHRKLEPPLANCHAT